MGNFLLPKHSMKLFKIQQYFFCFHFPIGDFLFKQHIEGLFEKAFFKLFQVN